MNNMKSVFIAAVLFCALGGFIFSAEGEVSNRYCQVTNNDILCFTITYLTSNFVKHSWCSRLTIMIEKASYFNITYIMVLY